MKTLKFIVSGLATAALVAGVGCSSMHKTTTSRYTGDEDRVATRTDTTLIQQRSVEDQAPVAVMTETPVVIVERAPVVATSDTFTERVAKADRN